MTHIVLPKLASEIAICVILTLEMVFKFSFQGKAWYLHGAVHVFNLSFLMIVNKHTDYIPLNQNLTQMRPFKPRAKKHCGLGIFDDFKSDISLTTMESIDGKSKQLIY